MTAEQGQVAPAETLLSTSALARLAFEALSELWAEQMPGATLSTWEELTRDDQRAFEVVAREVALAAVAAAIEAAQEEINRDPGDPQFQYGCREALATVERHARRFKDGSEQ